MRPYISIGRYSPLSLIVGMLPAFMGGILAGGCVYFVYLYFLTEGDIRALQVSLHRVLAVAIVAGGISIALSLFLQQVTHKLKIRHVPSTRILGIVAGVSMFLSLEMYMYWNFLDHEYRISDQGYGLSRDEVIVLTEQYLQSETGATGFIGFVLLLTHHLHSWLRWLGECGLLVLIIAIVSHEDSKPFNEQCNSWFTENVTVGHVSWEQREQVITMIKSGDYENAGKLITRQSIPEPCLDVEVALSKEGCDVLLTLREVNPRAATVKKERGLITADEFDRLRSKMLGSSSI